MIELIAHKWHFRMLFSGTVFFLMTVVPGGCAHSRAPDGGDSDEQVIAANQIPQENAELGSHEHHDSGDHGELQDPGSIADAFYYALSSADIEAVRSLLAPDVLILEGGHAQKSREEYMSAHMKADMSFLADVAKSVNDRDISQDGDLAWVVTYYDNKGSYGGKVIDIQSRQMLVMRRTGHSWKIALVHAAAR